MRLHIAVFLTLALAGCSTTIEIRSPGKDIEAVRDFVAASELQELNSVRLNEQIKMLYVNDFYIILPNRRDQYLIEFRGRCAELRERKWLPGMVDIRVNSKMLYSDHDTIRGCVIGKIYEIQNSQLEELRVLGDAPGNEVSVSHEG